METPLLNRLQSRRIDEIAIQEYGFTGIVLMENAGRNCAERIKKSLDGCAGPVVVACGPGNNGGDGFVIARHLAIHAVTVKLITFCEPAQMSSDAFANYQIAVRMNLFIEQFQPHWTDQQIHAAFSHVNSQPTEVFVDALLGTGAIGNPRPPIDRAIHLSNELPLRRIAIDIPTGLDCDRGVANHPTFRADETLTFVCPKTGFAKEGSLRYTGEVETIEIGIPQGIVTKARSESQKTHL